MQQNVNKVAEYNVKDEEKLKEFYLLNENKKRTSRILHALKKNQSAKRVWQAGIIGLLGMHVTQWMKFQFTWKNTSLFLLELLLWSTGISIVWFRKLRQDYSEELIQSSERVTKEFESILKARDNKSSSNNNAWVMKKEDDNTIVGTVAFKFDQETKEGKIGYLTGVDKQVRLELLQHAFQFGKEHHIKVISKWRHDTLDLKWSESNNDLL